jgi:arsenate reductase-like glutaredoxin family protein
VKVLGIWKIFFKKVLTKLKKYGIIYMNLKKEGFKMKKVKMICFDMDGTIADLYGVPNWLQGLRSFNPTPYEQAEPMWDMEELNKVLEMLQAQGIEIRVISWLSKDSNRRYNEQVRQAKRNWLKKQNFVCNNVHLVKYGTTKANCIRKYLAENELAILIDDNEQVRNGWNLGTTINPTEENIIEILKSLI